MKILFIIFSVILSNQAISSDLSEGFNCYARPNVQTPSKIKVNAIDSNGEQKIRIEDWNGSPLIVIKAECESDKDSFDCVWGVAKHLKVDLDSKESGDDYDTYQAKVSNPPMFSTTRVKCIVSKMF